jgi:hypothetical protein
MYALAWGLLLCASCVYFFSTNDADPDLWGHVFFGRQILASGAVPRLDTYSYTNPGRPWVDHEWLAQVAFAALYDRLGAAGLLLLKLLIGSSTFVLVLWRLRARGSAWVWGGVGLLTVAVLARGFAFRPQIFTYLGTALTLAVLDLHQRGSRRTLWVLPALFALWANLHGGFPLGLGVVAIFAAAAMLQEPATALQIGLVVLASLAATMLNPYGSALLAYIWNELRRAHPITEWQPAAIGDTGQFAFFVMLAAFVATLAWVRDWRAHAWEVLLAVAAAALALRHQRHTPVFALCAATPLARQLQAAGAWLGRRSGTALSPASGGAIGIALLTLAGLQLFLTGRRVERDGLQIVFASEDYPVAAVRALRAVEARANLAVPLEWGEYVLWFLAPRVKVSIDGRFATAFSEQVVRDNFDFFAGTPGWRRLIEDYPTDAALVPHGSACPLATLPGWQLVYEDAVARMYARAGSAAWPARLHRSEPTAASTEREDLFP